MNNEASRPNLIKVVPDAVLGGVTAIANADIEEECIIDHYPGYLYTLDEYEARLFAIPLVAAQMERYSFTHDYPHEGGIDLVLDVFDPGTGRILGSPGKDKKPHDSFNLASLINPASPHHIMLCLMRRK